MATAVSIIKEICSCSTLSDQKMLPVVSDDTFTVERALPLKIEIKFFKIFLDK